MKIKKIIAACTAVLLTAGAFCAGMAIGPRDLVLRADASGTAEAGAAEEGSAESGIAESVVDLSRIEVPALQPEISLTLDEAVEKMKTDSVRSRAAELQRDEDRNVARGYTDKIRAINEADDDIDLLKLAAKYGIKTSVSVIQAAYKAQEAGATTGNRKILAFRKQFAMEHLDANYQAAMNAIEAETRTLYYSVRLAEQNLKASEENLAAVQDNADVTEKKVNAGVLTNKDLMEAKSSVEEAKTEVRKNTTTLDYAKMSFNYLLGYNPQQPVNFTSEIPDDYEGSINPPDLAVSNALKARNEIAAADMAVTVYKLVKDSLEGSISRTSADYLTADLNILNAEQTQINARGQIEVDIRNRYNEIQNLKADLDAAKALLDYAEEGLRLVKISSGAGMSTTQELVETQVKYYKAQLNLNKVHSDYIQAAQQYLIAQGVGTSRIPL